MHESRHGVLQLIRSFVVVGAGNYGAMFLSLGINALLTRTLGVEQFGHLALLLTASQVLALLCANWTQSALVRFGAQEFAASGSLANAFWTRIWVMAPWLAGGLAIMAGGHREAAAYLMIPSWGLAAVTAHFFAAFLLITLGSVFQARGEMHRYGLMLLLDKAMMAATLVAIIAAGIVATPLRILLLNAASSSAVVLWGLSRIGVDSLRPVRLDRAAFGRMFAFSFPLLLSSWVGLFGTNWFDILVIKRYRPLSEVGLFSLGTVLAGVVQQITIIFSTLLLPQLSVMVASGDVDKIRGFVDRVLPYWFLATALVFTAVIFVVGPVVPMIFGHNFAPATRVTVILMLASCALALFNAFSPLLTAYGATWALTGIALTSGAVNVLCDLALIPSRGIAGAALATVIAYAVSAVLVLVYVQRRLRQNVFRLAVLALPVCAVCACFLWFDTATFYLVALPVGVVTLGGLAYQYHLFRGDDAAFFAPWSLDALLRRMS